MAGNDLPPDDDTNAPPGTPRKGPAVPLPPRPPSPRPASVPNLARPARPSSTGTPAPPTPPARPPAPRPPTVNPPPPRTVPRPPTAAARAEARPARPPTTPPETPAPKPARGGPAGVELEIGQVFAGRYRINKQVGRGGMGAVYLATQEPLARPVAIKVLHVTADDTTVARFQREARLIAQLQHPHIVGLIDFGEDDGRLYLVMEFIDGESLTSILKRESPFPARRVVEIALQIAEALSVAHDIQVVHRDLKPDNIMVLPTAGGQDFIKMLDFGVAKIRREGDAESTVQTKAGLIVGSLRYISPEQVESGDITPRTDLYSFGCVLYEMLAGRRVFEYPSPADCAIAHLTEAPRPPEVQGRRLTGPLVDFIMRCLDKKPMGRPADAREALKALMACRERPIDPWSLDADSTVAGLNGGLDLAQSAHTMQAPAGALTGRSPRPATPGQATPGQATPGQATPGQAAPDARAQDVRPTVTAIPAQATPRPEAPLRLPDAQLRPARPSGAQTFAIVGGPGGDGEVGHTSTHLQGVQLLPRGVPAQKVGTRWWVWALLFVAVAGVGAAVVLLLAKPGSDTPHIPVETVAAAPDTTSASVDVAPAAAPDVAPEVAAEVATADVAAEVAADAQASDATEDELHFGTRLVTVPEGAAVLRDKKPLCKTPCLVPWTKDEAPPTLRISLKGYVEIDMQLVRGDHGTEQRLELRKLP